MVGLGRVELPTYGLGNRRSIQLSYRPARCLSLRYIDSAEKHVAKLQRPGNTHALVNIEGQRDRFAFDVLGDFLKFVQVKRLADVIAGKVLDSVIDEQAIARPPSTGRAA